MTIPKTYKTTKSKYIYANTEQLNTAIRNCGFNYISELFKESMENYISNLVYM